MYTVAKNQLKQEEDFLKDLYNKYEKITKQAQRELEENGYQLENLGTSKKCRTRSGEIGFKYGANDNAVYFGIGFYNFSVSAPNGYRQTVYRAWVKQVTP